MRMPQTTEMHHGQALALIVVVYILAALGTLAFALAFRSQAGLCRVQLSIDRTQEDQMALAACAEACRLLTRDDPNVDSYDDAWSGWHAMEARPESGGGRPLGQVWWRLADESAKINVNRMSADVLLRIEGLDPAVVASILDWIDEDDVPNPDGAEKEYYAGLSASYACRNGPLENREELALVKGITPELYFGARPDVPPDNWGDRVSEQVRPREAAEGPIGLGELLTPYGDGRINLNTALPETLKALPFLSEAAVSEILAHQQPRAVKFAGAEDIAANDVFSATDKIVLLQAGKCNSGHFQLQVECRLEGTPRVCEYAAILERSKGRVRVLNWQRQLPHGNRDRDGVVDLASGVEVRD